MSKIIAEEIKHSWSPATLEVLLSRERMATYFNATSRDGFEAYELYRLNMEMAGQLLMVTGMVEVITRNAIDLAMVNWASRSDKDLDWLDSPVFHGRTAIVIHEARAHVKDFDFNKRIHSKVIAELPFGFWRQITSRRYLTSLWMPSLHHAFPYGSPDLRSRQREVSSVLVKMNRLRNRAAHLEPLFNRNYQGEIDSAHDLLGWVSPEAAAWFLETVERSELERTVTLIKKLCAN